MKTWFLSLMILAIAGSALAQCPNAIDTWSTTTGNMLGGRASEAWCGLDGAPLQPGETGNEQNAMSWDGAALGTQWHAWGMTVDAAGATLLDDTVNGKGNGTRTYGTNYDGGEFWLTRDNSWADGLADLTGTLTSYYVIITYTFVDNVAVGATSNISFTGAFNNCAAANECEISFAIANALLIWGSGDVDPMPANYPPFLCGSTLGELFDVCCITLAINCAVPEESTSWGGLKAQYR